MEIVNVTVVLDWKSQERWAVLSSLYKGCIPVYSLPTMENTKVCAMKKGGEQAWHISYHVLNISRKKTQGPSHLAFLLE
jgi:hypothetical protein